MQPLWWRSAIQACPPGTGCDRAATQTVAAESRRAEALLGWVSVERQIDTLTSPPVLAVCVEVTPSLRATDAVEHGPLATRLLASVLATADPRVETRVYVAFAEDDPAWGPFSTVSGHESLRVEDATPSQRLHRWFRAQPPAKRDARVSLHLLPFPRKGLGLILAAEGAWRDSEGLKSRE